MADLQSSESLRMEYLYNEMDALLDEHYNSGAMERGAPFGAWSVPQTKKDKDGNDAGIDGQKPTFF